MTADDNVYDIHSYRSIEDVATITSEEVLREIYFDVDIAIVEISAFIESRRFAGIVDDDWFYRASGSLARFKILQKWVERRMLTLKFEVPYFPTDQRSKELKKLNDAISKMKLQIFGYEQKIKKMENGGVD